MVSGTASGEPPALLSAEDDQLPDVRMAFEGGNRNGASLQGRCAARTSVVA